MQLLGASVDEVWNYLESQFQPGMTRYNHGLWHLDHKKPCASFDLSDPKQQAISFSTFPSSHPPFHYKPYK